MNKLREKMIRFMSGRYGWDALGTFLFITSLIIDVIGLFTSWNWLSIIAEVLLIWEIFRMFSRQIWSRQRENKWFMDHTKKIRHHFQVLKRNHIDRTYKYYVCPKCGQIVRVPRGHGKIEITCPHCQKSFTRKS